MPNSQTSPSRLKPEPVWRVVWEVDVWAPTAAEAAQAARDMQLCEDSIATVYTVVAEDGKEEDIDLGDIGE